jgi:hypothetical protein
MHFTYQFILFSDFNCEVHLFLTLTIPPHSFSYQLEPHTVCSLINLCFRPPPLLVSEPSDYPASSNFQFIRPSGWLICVLSLDSFLFYFLLSVLTSSLAAEYHPSS